jgi:hypothetical protein
LFSVKLSGQQKLKGLKIKVFKTLKYYSIQHNVKKFVCDFWQAGGFLWFPPPKNTESHNITEILLEVALNTITPPHQSHSTFYQTSD